MSASIFGFRALREQADNVQQQRINELAKKLARFVTQNEVVNADDEEDLISNGVMHESAVKYNDTFYHVKKYDDWTDKYYPAGDFDGGLLSTYLRGDHIGMTLKDYSQYYNNFAYIFGEPVLKDGNLDQGNLGGKYKALCLRLNRPTSQYVNAEWLQIPDNIKLQINGIATGFSIIIRIRPQSFANQGSLNATIFQKVDDNSPNNATLLEIDNTGRLIWTVRRSSTNYRVKVPIGSAMSTNTIYEVALTYAVSGNALKIYINGSDTSATSDGGSPTWLTDTTNHDAFFFRRGTGASNGFMYSDFYLLKYWKEKILSGTEVSNHNTNKWSISSHAFGAVGVVDHSTPYSVLVTGSFTSGSFTSTSFTL